MGRSLRSPCFLVTEGLSCHLIPPGACWHLCRKFPIHAGFRDDAIRLPPCWRRLCVPCGARGYAGIAEWLHQWPVDICHRLGDLRRPLRRKEPSETC